MSASREIRINRYDLEYYRHKFRFPNELPTVLMYLRVSSLDQVIEGHGLETQEARVREALDHKYGVDSYNRIVVADEGVTGRKSYLRDGLKSRDARPGLTFVTQVIQSCNVHCVAVYKISRIARDARIFFDFVGDCLKPYGVGFISAAEQIDFSTRTGEAFASLLAVLAGIEWGGIREQCYDGIQARIALGYPHGTLGYGWQSQDRRTLPHGARVGIEPCEDEAEVVKLIFHWYKSGRHVCWIVRELESRKIPAPKGGPRWSPCTAGKILRNPLHCGYVRRGETLIKGAHYDRRLVSEGDFVLVQRRLEERSHCGPVGMAWEHLVGGIARCAVCGRKMRVREGARNRPRYVCPGGRNGEEHAQFSVDVGLVDERIVDAIRRVATAPDVLEGAAETLELYLFKQADDFAQKTDELTAKQAALQETFGKTLRLYHDGKLDEEEFALAQDSYRGERDRLQIELDEARRNSENTEGAQARFETGLQMLRRFSFWDAAQTHEKQAMAFEIIEGLTFHPEDREVRIELKLIVGREEIFALPTHGRRRDDSTGLSSLSPTELTTGLYYLDGHGERQIADKRDMLVDTIYLHKARIIKCTGAPDLHEALKALAPVVEERKSELLIERRRPRGLAAMFSKSDTDILSCLARGMSKPEIARARSRSPFTVAKQVSRIYGKLRVHNARQALRKARILRLIDGAAPWSDRPTARQLVVLQELHTGCSQPVAAKRLRMTLAALKERIRCMFHKFGVNRIADLLRLARERGWLEA